MAVTPFYTSTLWDHWVQDKPDTLWIGRLAQACKKAAIAIHAEDPATANHAGRVMWARTAMQNPEAMARTAMDYIVSEAKYAANGGKLMVDADVSYCVTAQIDNMSKQYQ
jgi:hypothetical protein